MVVVDEFIVETANGPATVLHVAVLDETHALVHAAGQHQHADLEDWTALNEELEEGLHSNVARDVSDVDFVRAVDVGASVVDEFDVFLGVHLRHAVS